MPAQHKRNFALMIMLLFFAALQASAKDNAPGQLAKDVAYTCGAPSWQQTFTCSSASDCPRFVVLADMADEAVLDRETCLVWERAPSIIGVVCTGPSPCHTQPPPTSAPPMCNLIQVGGRMGWRYPSQQELLTLIDPAVSSSPALPPGHPFLNVQSFLGSSYMPVGPWYSNQGWGTSVTFAWPAPSRVTVALPATLFSWCVRSAP